jgi:hypothetical protein
VIKLKQELGVIRRNQQGFSNSQSKLLDEGAMNTVFIIALYI